MKIIANLGVVALLVGCSLLLSHKTADQHMGHTPTLPDTIGYPLQFALPEAEVIVAMPSAQAWHGSGSAYTSSSWYDSELGYLVEDGI